MIKCKHYSFAIISICFSLLFILGAISIDRTNAEADSSVEATVDDYFSWNGTFESYYGAGLGEFTVTYNNAEVNEIFGIPNVNADAGIYTLVAFAEDGSYSAHIYEIKPLVLRVIWNASQYESNRGEEIMAVDVEKCVDDKENIVNIPVSVSGIPTKEDPAGRYAIVATTENKNYVLTDNLTFYNIIDTSADERIAELERNVDNLTDRVIELNKQIDDLKDRIETLQSNYADSEEKIYALLQDVRSTLQGEIEELNRAMDELSTRLTDLGNELSESQLENETISAAMKDLQAEVEDKRSEVQKLMGTLDEQQCLLRSAQDKNEKLQNANQNKTAVVIILAVMSAVMCFAIIVFFILFIKKRKRVAPNEIVPRETEDDGDVVLREKKLYAIIGNAREQIQYEKEVADDRYNHNEPYDHCEVINAIDQIGEYVEKIARNLP